MMRVRLLGILALAVLAPAAVDAAMVDTTDPCYVAFYGGDPGNVLATGSWENRDHLARAAVELRLVAESLTSPTILALAANASPEMLDLLRAKYRCLDWLRRLHRRIEDQMKKIELETVSVPDERHRPTVDELMREIQELIDEAEREMEEILRR